MLQGSSAFLLPTANSFSPKKQNLMIGDLYEKHLETFQCVHRPAIDVVAEGLFKC
jgi:hypothetical protein